MKGTALVFVNLGSIRPTGWHETRMFDPLVWHGVSNTLKVSIAVNSLFRTWRNGAQLSHGKTHTYPRSKKEERNMTCHALIRQTLISRSSEGTLPVKLLFDQNTLINWT